MSTRDREQAVRELAEEIVRTANGSCYPFEGENREALVASVEPLLQAFLAEREGGREERALWKLGKARSRSAELAGEVAALRGALEELVATVRGECPSLLSEDTVGALLIEDALDSDAGRAEAEVIQAAIAFRAHKGHETKRGFAEIERLHAAVDALLAALGGEG